MLPIRVRGARTNNLRDVSLELEPGQLIAIVGAFRSRQVFARVRHALRRGTAALRGEHQHLRAPVPRAPGATRCGRAAPVPAGIAVDCQGEIRTSRSTVGSLTDVADYAKSLWAHLASLTCTRCGAEVKRTSPEAAGAQRAGAAARASACWSCIACRSGAGGVPGLRDALVSEGYRRLRVDGEVRRPRRGASERCGRQGQGKAAKLPRSRRGGRSLERAPSESAVDWSKRSRRP